MHDGNELGERIARLRCELDKSQQDVANDLKIRRETVTQWENGTRYIKAADIVMLSQYFHVTTDYLLGQEPARSHDASYICKETGLSEDAVRRLMLYNKGETGLPEDVARRLTFYSKGDTALSDIGFNAISFLNELIASDEVVAEIGTQYEHWISAIKDYHESSIDLVSTVLKGDPLKPPDYIPSLSTIINGERYETVRKFEKFLSNVDNKLSNSYIQTMNDLVSKLGGVNDGNDNKDEN